MDKLSLEEVEEYIVMTHSKVYAKMAQQLADTIRENEWLCTIIELSYNSAPVGSLVNSIIQKTYYQYKESENVE